MLPDLFELKAISHGLIAPNIKSETGWLYCCFTSTVNI